jgi:hypothetical protein
VAAPCIAELDRRGRIVEHLGVKHVSFPTWTRIEIPAPGDDTTP